MIRWRPSISVSPHQPLPIIWLFVVVGIILVSEGVSQLLIIVAEWVVMQ
jgi:hypothetical protein